MLNFLNFKKVNHKENMDLQQVQNSRMIWTNKEIAIVISAIEDSKCEVVNINYLGRLLRNRTESAIRNKVLEFAKMMQRFKLKTTIVSNNKDNFDDFVRRILSRKKRNMLINLFYKFGIFDTKTNKLIIENFWKI